MKAINKARIVGWGQLAIVYLNQALSQNGGVIPTDKSGWLALGSSLLVAIGIHVGSSTSAGHPDGKNTQAGFARGPALILALGCCLLPVALSSCHRVNSSNPAVIQESSLLDARKAVNSVAHGLKAANDTVRNLAATEPDYYNSVHPKFAALAKLNDTADACITTAENGGTCNWKTAVSSIAQAAGDPATLTTFGFKNSASQQKVQLGFTALVDAIKLASQFGGQ